jgi:hypothetical protein
MRALFLVACSAIVVPTSAADIAPLSAAERAAMTGKSWQPGCPVPLDDLVSVKVKYQGTDSAPHTGSLIVHKRVASDVAAIFAELYAAKFPIYRIEPWEKYGANVYAEQNITTGFYCEKADDAPTEWSSHAYGLAVDINPLFNPFLDLNHVWWPKAAAPYVTRDDVPGKISTNSEAFRIFTRHGWSWGGFDAGVPDYMHFNALTVGNVRERFERPYVVTGLRYVPGGAQETAQPK